MSGGWVKKHQDELMLAAGIGALGAATGGFGLLGGGAAAASGGAAAGATEGLLAGGLGAGAAEEVTAGMLASQLPQANSLSVGLGNLATQYGPAAKRFGQVAYLGNQLGVGREAPQPVPPAFSPGPAPQIPDQSASWQQMFPNNVVDPETERRRRLAMMRQGGWYG